MEYRYNEQARSFPNTSHRENSGQKAAFSQDGKRFTLYDPKLAAKADTFLWNNKMLCHVTAHGFAQSQFMQPEPAFYAHAPLLAAKAAMAPEPQYFDHHPGRFFYLRDDETGDFFSAPYRPANIPLDRFEFSAGLSDVTWLADKFGIETRLRFALPFGNDIVELWQVVIRNNSNKDRKISLYTYFPIGFPSWMNTEGNFNYKIGGILAYTLTPYRKLEDYYTVKNLKDFTYLLSDRKPDSWEASLNAFEGYDGLRQPEALKNDLLSCTEAAYETTACIMQFKIRVRPGETVETNLLFGPAANIDEIKKIKQKYLQESNIDNVVDTFNQFYENNRGCIQINTPDKQLDHFVNNWLPRQIMYHAYTLRMVTDSQTRNHIQDAMGMIYIDPPRAKELFKIALKQQKTNGEMPDGIILRTGAELKYVNQIPHRDHSVWAAYAIESYLNESADFAFLDEELVFKDSAEKASVYEHVCRGIEWLIKDRSERGLSYIGQGDWNDPLNMAGYRGNGESIWLSQAMVYAIKVWLPMCAKQGDTTRFNKFKNVMDSVNKVLNSDGWDKKWYARGFTDEGVKFGVAHDKEGQIFLNTQSFGILCGAAQGERLKTIVESVDEHLSTPFGLVLLAPSYTHMREDIGRVTQKHPSIAENGSIYSHANAFYTYALYTNNYGEKAYKILRSLIPGPDYDDVKQREHLPIYIPNYYRGSHNPRVMGKASHLMNTGSLPWFYRCIIENMLGLTGEKDGLRLNPQLPPEFTEIFVTRKFRATSISITMHHVKGLEKIKLKLNGNELEGNFIKESLLLEENSLEVAIPQGTSFKNEGSDKI